MPNITITLKHNAYTSPIVNSARSKLGKRGITGGVQYDLNDFSAAVIQELLHGAITDFLQVGLKNVDQDKATIEECQAAMNARLELLKAGSLSAGAGARKPPQRDPIKARARAMLKKMIQDQFEEKLDAKTLNSQVTQLFSIHKEYGKTQNEELEAHASLVEEALTMAREEQKRQEKLTASLAGVAVAAKKASDKAKEEAPAAAKAPKPKAPAKKKPTAKGPSA